MERNTYICTLFYAEQENEESLYPNIGTPYKSSSFEFQEIYWRSILVFFSTSYRYSNYSATS
ncbi:hypothetical protein HPK10_11535 [Anoxybacillus flavithermus]|uniref:hypothetical protein n=1 Tax=Anoxybacillus flavithermus TaxID=33934 RepID=UPI0018678898|nr:hypothetical protein [Anoxybacillus flavithermus]MBE2943847.1 hypothetical protein [Anoxybacillus flavithermus]MBE2952141.1 hypothetical protein [Anoxybacillus flavithermus]MBE2954742.1 hypothetical protein [Anoxybacillus flavithermus]MBE2960122.1 hypothetical protein [Anoxybacillus flavithermus]